MTEYRRWWLPGGTYFFTVNLAERRRDLLVRHIDVLREAVRQVKARHPFRLDAVVVLPDHLHCVITLPHGDDDFAVRLGAVKANFSRRIPGGERRSPSRLSKRERGVWQRRYWEHVIRNEDDFRRHVDYLHFNPVKHGLVTRVSDWPYSSFHRYVRRGAYPLDWAACADDVAAGER